MSRMKVMFCSSEVTPYAKTGGLADVSSALPAELKVQGVDCFVVMPYYTEVKSMGLPLRPYAELAVLTGTGISEATVFSYNNIFFVSHPLFSDRKGLYSYAGNDYPDNLERFAFFSRACVELLRYMGDVDVVHCNDWQTALVLAYLKDAGIDSVSSVFTIHNLAYQGLFDAILWSMLFLPKDYFRIEGMEYYGRINILKAGLVYADAVNTVSPTYAKEIQTREFGSGLEGLLQSISYKLSGIVNGIDIEIWDPAQDSLIAQRYSIVDMKGKQVCKRALLEMFSLPLDKRPLFGLISRLVEQKGIDCVLDALPQMAAMGAKVVVLGNGNPAFEQRLMDFRREYPGHLGIHIGFDEGKAHAIEAGSDFFLMPSRFEPCGLNQMISMRYGTIPITTCVGGLKDTVVALGEGERPYGLRISSPDTAALLDSVAGAIRVFTDEAALMSEMKTNAMEQDVSWKAPAGEYKRIYHNLKDFRERSR